MFDTLQSIKKHKKNNSLELSKAILYVLKNKNIAKKFSDEGLKIIKKRFTMNKMVNAHEKEYLKYVNPWHKKM